MAQEYGDVVRWRGLFTLYIINNPDHVRQILTQDYPRFIKDTIDYRVLAQSLNKGLVKSDGKLWRQQRNGCANAATLGTAIRRCGYPARPGNGPLSVPGCQPRVIWFGH